jgi:hypothetical protein
MAYKQKLWMQCDASGCTAKATYKVCNRYNGEIGRFCSKHATSRLNELERYEQESYEREQP